MKNMIASSGRHIDAAEDALEMSLRTMASIMFHIINCIFFAYSVCLLACFFGDGLLLEHTI